jgi:membrane protein YdbS with pleckstrin-like domain
LRTVRRITLLLLLVPLTALGVVLAQAFEATAVAVLVAVVAVALGVAGWSAVERNWRAWGYAERADDLLVVHGVLTRRLVVVPYGRMQFVDVYAGVVDRMFGLAKVQLHTASASSDAYIPGLGPQEAARLRDRLATRGEARLAGL